MTDDVSQDQLVVLRIEGMHCHRCEQTIKRALAAYPGVRETEVDFLSGQASVLFDRGSVSINELTQSVRDAGYEVTGFTQPKADAHSTPHD